MYIAIGQHLDSFQDEFRAHADAVALTEALLQTLQVWASMPTTCESTTLLLAAKARTQPPGTLALALALETNDRPASTLPAAHTWATAAVTKAGQEPSDSAKPQVWHLKLSQAAKKRACKQKCVKGSLAADRSQTADALSLAPRKGREEDS